MTNTAKSSNETQETLHQNTIKIGNLQREIQERRVRAAALRDLIMRLAVQAEDHFSSQLQQNAEDFSQALKGYAPASQAGWADPAWSSWTPVMHERMGEIRVGELRSDDGGIVVPVFVPFIGRGRSVVILGKGAQNEQAISLMQSLVVRTALSLPHQAQYTLLDPAGSGMAFPMRRMLPRVSDSSAELRQELDDILANIQRIISEYLDSSVRSFDQLPAEIRINEPYHLIFAADFPNHYDRRAIEALQHIATTGPAAGTYVFLHHNQDYPLPRDLSLNGFENAFVVATNMSSYTDLHLESHFDGAPPSQQQATLLEAVRNAKPPDLAVSWDSAVGIDEQDWWKCSSTRVIETPIGMRGRSQKLNIWFGANTDGRPCVHGVLAGMPGSGKSKLHHALICGLAVRYSPRELRLYLVDGKDGVEFQCYRHLPHVEVVSLRTSPELARSILAELVAEKERRNEVFARAGATDLSSYRQMGHEMPRILLVVDEYQEFFEGDRDGVASGHLLQLAQQGRSAGIHMLLGSQSFMVVGMLYRPQTFANVHLRIAMKHTRAEVRDLSDFGRRGRALIEACTMPGQVVINDQTGDDGANHMGRVCLIDKDQITGLVQKLAARGTGLPERALPHRVVFDGKAQPSLTSNPYVAQLAASSHWFSDEETEEWARQPFSDGGLGIADWYRGQRPYVAWVGQQFAVRGQTTIVVRRGFAENAMLVGGNEPVRQAMSLAILASLALNAPPASSQFYVFHAMDNDPVSERFCNEVLRPAGFVTLFTRDSAKLEALLDRLLETVAARQAMSASDAAATPSLFALLVDLDRIPIACRKVDRYGDLAESPLGMKLKQLYVDGPMVGVHLFLSFSAASAMSAVIDQRRGLANFRHRVALQMSDDDSYALIRNRLAARLQHDGQKPIRALYRDMVNDSSLIFRPYSSDASATEGSTSLSQELDAIGARLLRRR